MAPLGYIYIQYILIYKLRRTHRRAVVVAAALHPRFSRAAATTTATTARLCVRLYINIYIYIYIPRASLGSYTIYSYIYTQLYIIDEYEGWPFAFKSTGDQ